MCILYCFANVCWYWYLSRTAISSKPKLSDRLRWCERLGLSNSIFGTVIATKLKQIIKLKNMAFKNLFALFRLIGNIYLALQEPWLHQGLQKLRILPPKKTQRPLSSFGTLFLFAFTKFSLITTSCD